MSSAAPLTFRKYVMAVERVEELLRAVTDALNGAKIPYAVVGGNAVATWVASKDPEAVRATKDVDILVERADLEKLEAALSPLGFDLIEVLGVSMFVERTCPNPKFGVYLVFAGERIKSHYETIAPSVDESDGTIAEFRVVNLLRLLDMKLQSFRDVDRTHIRDLIGVEVIDETWVKRVHPALQDRLQMIFDNPE